MRSPSRPTSQIWACADEALRRGRTVGSIELKVLLDATVEEATGLLGPSVTPPVLRRVHYLDTPDLLLQRHELIARVRTTTVVGRDRVRGDVTVKLCRPRRRSRGLPVELDVFPSGVRWSATARRRVPSKLVARALAVRRPARRLLSSTQRKLVAAAGIDTIDDLVLFGPVDVLRLTSATHRGRLVVEAWRLPGGRRLAEVSMKCRPADTRVAMRVLKELIRDGDVTVSERQASKTQIVLSDCCELLIPHFPAQQA